jgi:TRAP-type C4-dicarboxylate transport system substrate-binding protein
MKRLATIAITLAAWLGGTSLARADETTLLFGTSTPPGTHISVRVFHPWAVRINEQGKGIVRIDIRDGLEIANPGNFYSRVRDDVIQIGWGSHNSVPGTFALSGFSNMPFQTESSETSSVAFWRLIKSGYFDAEYKDIVPLFVQIYPQSQIHLAKAPKAPEDVNGLRLMVVAKTAADTATRLGAAPISLLLPELYQGLQRNTVDGALMSWTAFQPFKLAEVTTYHIDTRLGTPPAMVFMAKKRYEALSSEARKIIDANSGEAESRALGKAWDEVEDEARQAAKKDPKHTVVTPSPELTAKWQAAVAPVTDAWVKATPGGDKVLAAFHETLVQVKAGQ